MILLEKKKNNNYQQINIVDFLDRNSDQLKAIFKKISIDKR
jgi:hypothetical protein